MTDVGSALAPSGRMSSPMRQATKKIGRQMRLRVLKHVFAAAALSLTLSGCVGYDGDLQGGYVMDDRLLNQVRVGSSAEQVLVVMGTPSTTSTVGGSAWYYVSTKTTQALAFQKPSVADRRVFAVYFDPKKKVDRVANYGLEDGKVIDFNTRTTPTAGGESSFVQNMLQGLLKFQS
jgi:outer membrane protein assembly factor BamE (lipoprotein component of BamABCDE complex)